MLARRKAWLSGEASQAPRLSHENNCHPAHTRNQLRRLWRALISRVSPARPSDYIRMGTVVVRLIAFSATKERKEAKPPTAVIKRSIRLASSPRSFTIIFRR